MSGLFGVVSRRDCVQTLFYGTDYHSHLGTQKAGMVVLNSRLQRSIHDISTSQFKSKFIEELPKMKGTMGLGVISDSNPQPIIIASSFGNFALVTNGLLENKNELVAEIKSQGGSFSELSAGVINSTEVVGKLIAQKKDIVAGITSVLAKVRGSVSLLVLGNEGVYAARDHWGRTPLIIGQKSRTWVVASETCAFPNLGFTPVKELLPGEIVLLTKNGLQEKRSGRLQEKICAFLWIYTGYPASSYDGVAVEAVRERCGINLAKRDKIKADLVTGVPDSGIAHALGYAQASGIPYRRPLVKYTSGYGRSYTPPSQQIRDQVAKMKLIPIKDVIAGKSIVICDDSIVRGTQLKNQALEKLWHDGAKAIHVRIACPPLLFPCRYCLSTRTRKELAARRAIKKAYGSAGKKIPVAKLLDETTPEYQKMIKTICQELGATSLRYQSIKEMVKAIGLPRNRLCLFCWNGQEA
ncbi:amidophosphoribosyltransferase [Candidatus Shapirobacteria bacterium CG09_land_8_20_14_0_10_49_15]|uniref:Amidophosphoribosyltransferase n=2 Tax=Candidatus Shapironibacteriota TaxID=1752721 RepID=A0A2M8L6P6_9BACT|nr:MAG: amidophosphoribosyltransferase [Candidatus Shapirobacteria bacterium CG09_land_8_20_14_0_10_49_15]PJE69930.1 MAG: amidophosphoribosyltransferase [Candidatus Shapirobacteria bacterium CG10_big_fil_rev_8_21_14_0_10_48_15]